MKAEQQKIVFYVLVFGSLLILQATIPLVLLFGFMGLYYLPRYLFHKPCLKLRQGEFYYLLFLLVIFCGVVSSPDFSRPAFVFLRYFFLYLLWHDFSKYVSGTEKQYIFTAILVSALFMCAGGLFQVFISTDPMPVSWGNPQGLKRAFGLFDNPNLFASFLLLPLLAIIFCRSEIFSQNSNWQKHIPYLHIPYLKTTIALILLFMLVLTQSRGAIMAFCGSLALLLPFAPQKKQILLFLCLCIGGFFLSGRMNTLEKTNLGVNQRIELYQGLKKYAKAHWLFGTSPGSFHLHYPHYRTLGGYYPLYAHNHLLEILCESGIIGLLPFLIWLLLATGKALQLAHKGYFLPLSIVIAGVLNAQVNSSYSFFAICATAVFCFCLDFPSPSRHIADTPAVRPFRKWSIKTLSLWHIFCFTFLLYWLYAECQIKALMQTKEPLAHVYAHSSTRLKKELSTMHYLKQVIKNSTNNGTNNGELTVAMQWLQELKQQHPYEGEIPFLQAQIMLRTNNIEQAESLLQEALALDEWSEEYSYLLLLILRNTNPAEFKTLFEKIMNSNPDYLTENPWYERIKGLLER